MAVAGPADGFAKADVEKGVVAAGCAGVWEVGQGAGEVIVVGPLNGLTGRLDGVSGPKHFDDDSLARLADALCGDVPKLDVLGSGPDKRRPAEVFGLWWPIEAVELCGPLKIIERCASVGAGQRNALEVL